MIIEVHTLPSSHPVTFDENADPDAIRLAERLIQEGLCAPLTSESFSGYTGLVPSVGHDLAPTRLSAAAHQTVDDLGRPPDTLLRNPERTAPRSSSEIRMPGQWASG